MLDSDLAELYECKNGTKLLIKRLKGILIGFPKDLCFS